MVFSRGRGVEGGGGGVVVVERGMWMDYFEGRGSRRVERWMQGRWMQGWAFCSATLPLPAVLPPQKTLRAVWLFGCP